MLHFQEVFCFAGSQRVPLSGVSAVQDARHKLQHVQGAQMMLNIFRDFDDSDDSGHGDHVEHSGVRGGPDRG